jgi:predicted outer membrane repeat protein
VRDCTFTKNRTGLGAAINVLSSSATIERCTFDQNVVISQGSAIRGESSTLAVTNCTFSSNSFGDSRYDGGAVDLDYSTLNISGCTFTSDVNHAESGLYMFYSTASVSACSFSNHYARLPGGAIYGYSTTLAVNDSNFANNVSADSYNAVGAGGAIASYGASSLSIFGSTFTGNKAGDGGAVYSETSALLTISRCTFQNNTGNNSGGGLTVKGQALTLSDCTFVGNTGGNGGGLCFLAYNVVSPVQQITKCVFERNVANDGGGGAYCDGSTTNLRVMNSIFEGNTSFSAGGGMYTRLGRVYNSVFVGNSTYALGGGLSFASATELANCTFVSNYAGSGGGGADVSGTASSQIKNCIFWGNSTNHYVDPTQAKAQLTSGSTSVSYCLIDGGYGSGTGIINADPLFIRAPSPGPDRAWATADDDYGDLRVKPTSPCIDAGSGSLPSFVSTDIVGNPRKIDYPGVQDYGAIADMGAYERPVPAALLIDAAKLSLRYSFEFDVEPSTLTAADLTLVNVTTNQPIDCGAGATVTYDPSNRTATWQFTSTLPDGNYRANLAAGTITDVLGVPLEYDLLGDFYVLGGDANRDRVVDIRDLYIIATNWQGSGKVFSQGDFNYDGKVDAKDLGILSSHWQQALPPPPPAAPVSIVRAPTRTAARVVSVVG